MRTPYLTGLECFPWERLGYFSGLLCPEWADPTYIPVDKWSPLIGCEDSWSSDLTSCLCLLLMLGTLGTLPLQPFCALVSLCMFWIKQMAWYMVWTIQVLLLSGRGGNLLFISSEVSVLFTAPGPDLALGDWPVQAIGWNQIWRSWKQKGITAGKGHAVPSRWH
jgi:hypothetical protein